MPLTVTVLFLKKKLEVMLTANVTVHKTKEEKLRVSIKGVSLFSLSFIRKRHGGRLINMYGYPVSW